MHQGELVELGDHTILEKVDLLEKVYEVTVTSQAHPKMAKPQLFLTPKESNRDSSSFFQSFYEIKQDDKLIHISFKSPLRTVSNAVIRGRHLLG